MSSTSTYRYACVLLSVLAGFFGKVSGDSCSSDWECDDSWEPKCCSWNGECCSTFEYNTGYTGDQMDYETEIHYTSANLAVGVVVAIVIGGIIGCVACIVGCVYCCCRNSTSQGRVLGPTTTVVHTPAAGTAYTAGQPHHHMPPPNQPYLPPQPNMPAPPYSQPAYPGPNPQGMPPYPVGGAPYPVTQPPAYPQPQPPYPTKDFVQASAPPQY